MTTTSERKKKDKIERQEERCLKVRLTDERKLELSALVAQENQKAKTAEADMKATAKEMKAIVEKHQNSRDQCAETINQGYELKMVTCTVTLDYGSGTVTVIRDDTGETVETRKMSAEERQRPLPMDE